MSAGLPPRPLRRLLIDPLWLVLAPALALLLASLATLSWLAAQLGRPWRAPRYRTPRLAALAAYYLMLDLYMLLGCLLLWLRHPIDVHRDEPALRTAHTAIIRRALGRLMVAAERCLGFEVVLEGALPDPAPTPLLVLARHAGPGDSFTLVQLIAGYLDRCPRVVLKAALQWDPGLDVLLNRLSCCFLPSKSGAGEDRIAPLAELAAGLTDADALLLFPEGGNWTPSRHRRAVVRLLRAGQRRAARQARANRHVLPPRPGGTVACLAQRPDADVLVVAHTGLDKLVSPSLIWHALPLRGQPMRIGWWLEPAAGLPVDDDGRTEWLSRQWQRMDDWVAQRSVRGEQFAASGQRPAEEQSAVEQGTSLQPGSGSANLN